MQFMCAHPLSFRGVSVQQLWRGRGPVSSLLQRRSSWNSKRRRLWIVSANEQVEEPGEGERDGEGGGKEESEGDPLVQDALVGMVRLQTGKYRVSELVDERSKLLSEIADQAKEEYDRIAQDAMRTMDEASSKIISSVNAEAQAMEDELASARAEMEADSREFDEFEENVGKARSEGLFFKSLYSKPLKAWNDRTSEEKQIIKEEAKGVLNVAKKSGSSKTRRFLYGVLIFLLGLSLLEAVSSGEYPWPKLALYSLILVALVVQLTYESLVATGEDGDDSKSERLSTLNSQLTLRSCLLNFLNLSFVPTVHTCSPLCTGEEEYLAISLETVAQAGQCFMCVSRGFHLRSRYFWCKPNNIV